MANFTEQQIQQMMTSLKWEFGVENNTRELAILELEDLKRKGCTLEHIGECHGCSATKNGSECPLCDWEKRHPEYKDDELAMRIKVLEAGGEEAYKAKIEMKKNMITDYDKLKACKKLLNQYFEMKTTATVSGIVDLLKNILTAKTKNDVQNEFDKLN